MGDIGEAADLGRWVREGDVAVAIRCRLFA
jgi:hypothetical protein